MKNIKEKLPIYPDVKYGKHILKLFMNYVNHAKILHNTGRPEYYRRMDQLAALEKCTSYLHSFRGRNHLAICKVIPKLKHELEIILPVPSNSSYDSTRHRLTYLLILCEMVNKNSQQS